jgi:hypothetical protein
MLGRPLDPHRAEMAMVMTDACAPDVLNDLTAWRRFLEETAFMAMLAAYAHDGDEVLAGIDVLRAMPELLNQIEAAG